MQGLAATDDLYGFMVGGRPLVSGGEWEIPSHTEGDG